MILQIQYDISICRILSHTPNPCRSYDIAELRSEQNKDASAACAHVHHISARRMLLMQQAAGVLCMLMHAVPKPGELQTACILLTSTLLIARMLPLSIAHVPFE